MSNINRAELFRFLQGVIFFVILFTWLFFVISESQADASLVAHWQAFDLYPDHHGSTYLPLITR
jgi:hypothetical protein